MNEDAWLNITGCIDVTISLTAGYTTLNKFTVILEINRKDLFASFNSSDFSDAVFDINPLFR